MLRGPSSGSVTSPWTATSPAGAPATASRSSRSPTCSASGRPTRWPGCRGPLVRLGRGAAGASRARLRGHLHAALEPRAADRACAHARPARALREATGPLPAELDVVSRLAAERGRVLHTVHNWHHAPIVRRAAELIRDHAIGPVRRVAWQTLRVRPAATRDPAGVNWRLDPAVAGGGILTDHGWHVFYIVQRWIGARPQALSARLERRRHATLSVEDTATVRVTFPDATADILLTWAADERRNCAAGQAPTAASSCGTTRSCSRAARAPSNGRVPRAVQRVRTRTGSRRSPVSSSRRPAPGTRRQPGRGLALRHAREPRPRVEPP